jgi:hypothetical protein
VTLTFIMDAATKVHAEAIIVNRKMGPARSSPAERIGIMDRWDEKSTIPVFMPVKADFHGAGSWMHCVALRVPPTLDREAAPQAMTARDFQHKPF